MPIRSYSAMYDTFIANVNKPEGITSRTAMQRVKTLAGADKCGHAGTLDPLARGVLIVCSGRATKVSDLLLDLEKEYVATVRLGQETDTLDREGPVTGQCPVPPLDGETVESVLARFTGEIWQRPPMYSAVKKGGVPLYKLARKGLVTDRESRPVRVYSLELISLSLPYMTVKVACSRGTYVRS
ncbi:MAG: tRNA pseudouridine(55) synthase TruB, partial [Nitrospirae bacterium]|nr:tRNA pseudouridine(55) synthase TruB [Nitrospirota bacterium]